MKTICHLYSLDKIFSYNTFDRIGISSVIFLTFSFVLENIVKSFSVIGFTLVPEQVVVKLPFFALAYLFHL